jgi:hypothetical protein
LGYGAGAEQRARGTDVHLGGHDTTVPGGSRCPMCGQTQRRNRDCVYENNAQGCRIHKTEDTHREPRERITMLATMRFIAVRLVKVL